MFLHQTYITYALCFLYYKFTPTNTVCFLFHKNLKKNHEIIYEILYSELYYLISNYANNSILFIQFFLQKFYKKIKIFQDFSRFFKILKI
jgi:hypothetical protein